MFCDRGNVTLIRVVFVADMVINRLSMSWNVGSCKEGDVEVIINECRPRQWNGVCAILPVLLPSGSVLQWLPCVLRCSLLHYSKEPSWIESSLKFERSLGTRLQCKEGYCSSSVEQRYRDVWCFSARILARFHCHSLIHRSIHIVNRHSPISPCRRCEWYHIAHRYMHYRLSNQNSYSRYLDSKNRFCLTDLIRRKKEAMIS